VTNASGKYLNPGMIETTPFYKTTNDAQSKFYWGDRALQTGDKFDVVKYNDLPNAPKTAWGLQTFGQPMTMQQAMSILQGTPNTSSLSPAEQAYLAMLDPEAARQFLAIKGIV
jgi:hypothetical protein